MEKLFLAIICVFFLVGCDQQQPKPSRNRVVQTYLAGESLCIPRGYFKSWDDPSSPTVAIQTMYPDFQIPEKSPQEYWEEDEFWRQISFLIMDPKERKPFDQVIKNKIDFNGSTIIGMPEYGLEKRNKPANTTGGRLDRGDLWLEKQDGEYVSFVHCSKRHSITTRPQCMSEFLLDNFYINVRYDIRLLPEWEQIKDKTTTLVKDFNCKTQGE